MVHSNIKKCSKEKVILRNLFCVGFFVVVWGFDCLCFVGFLFVVFVCFDFALVCFSILAFRVL